MPTTLALVSLIIVVALIFDFTNGFHDAANSIATVVSTRVLTPGRAVVLAAFFNFIAAFGFGTAVASTIGKGLIDITLVNEWVILAGVLGAIAWNLITWYLGLPTSSSHALVGGYAGAAMVRSGFSALVWTIGRRGGRGQRGMNPFEAAIKGTKEVGLAVMATTMSLLAVLVPVGFMSGMVGRFMGSFGLTASAAICDFAVRLLHVNPDALRPIYQAQTKNQYRER